MQDELRELAKQWCAGRCGNKHIMYDEAELKEAAKVVLSRAPAVAAHDPYMKHFEEWWSFEGCKSVTKGSQGGQQRMRSKHESQLENTATKLVSASC